MFYRTQIKSVTTYGAVDMAGRPLSFIGYLPVKAGDWVYTDGRVIFGNVPPRGSAVTFSDEPSGVPVLGNEELSGYFSKSGRFKKYSIAQDDWIVNSDEKFAHGAEFIDETKVIDAGFSERGEKLVATNGFYRDSRTLKTNFFICTFDYRTWYRYGDPPYVWFADIYNYKQILGSESFLNEYKNAQIFANDKKDDEFDLEPYVKDIEKRALDVAKTIMNQAIVRETGYNYMSIDALGRVEARIHKRDINNFSAPPEEPFIAYSTAHILTSTVNEDGLDGLIFASTYGYCFPRCEYRFVKGWNADLVNAEVTHAWNTALGDEGLRYRKAYRLDENKCVPFGCSAIYQIGKMVPIAFRDFGGIIADVVVIEDGNGSVLDTVFGDPSGLVADIVSLRHFEILLGLAPLELDEDTLFPVGEGFYHMDKFGRLTFYNSDKKKIAENIPVHDDFYHIEIEHGEYTFNEYLMIFNQKPYLKAKVYTSDGKVEEKILVIDTIEDPLNYPDEAGNIIEKFYIEQGNPLNILEPSTGYYTFAPMDGYYIKYPTGILEALQFTPLFYQFSNGSYLYGVKDGKLYLKPKDGKEQLIGDGVKNFRLQELKKISKAKR